MCDYLMLSFPESKINQNHHVPNLDLLVCVYLRLLSYHRDTEYQPLPASSKSITIPVFFFFFMYYNSISHQFRHCVQDFTMTLQGVEASCDKP